MSTLEGVKRNIPPFRADAVGSYLRTQPIKDARAKFAEGAITKEALRKIEDAEIAKIVEKQKEVGLTAVTDGEFRRSWWHLDFLVGIEGIEKYNTADGIHFHDAVTKAESAKMVDKISFGNHPMLEDFKYLKSIAGDHVAKMTIPSPNMLYSVCALTSPIYKANPIYDTDEELLQAIIKVYKDAISAFYAAGCRYLQLDDTRWASLASKKLRQDLVDLGYDLNEVTKTFVRLINESIADRPSDMYITMHICHGNYRSTYYSEGSYDIIAEPLFGEVNIDGFFLEYDTERSGGFEPLKYIKDQQVVLGLITSKNGTLENKEDVINRIKEATKYVDINQVCLSPQCGFSSTEEGNILTEEAQWNKMRFIVDIANEIWK